MNFDFFPGFQICLSRQLIRRPASTKLIADRTMCAPTAIRCDQFRRPATRAKTEAQFVGESRLRHAQVVFRFIEEIPNVHGRVPVGRKIFARGPKLVGYEANGKQR